VSTYETRCQKPLKIRRRKAGPCVDRNRTKFPARGQKGKKSARESKKKEGSCQGTENRRPSIVEEAGARLTREARRRVGLVGGKAKQVDADNRSTAQRKTGRLGGERNDEEKEKMFQKRERERGGEVQKRRYSGRLRRREPDNKLHEGMRPYDRKKRGRGAPDRPRARKTSPPNRQTSQRKAPRRAHCSASETPIMPQR